MTTIAVSPSRPNEQPAFEVVNLEILVKDVDWMGFFDVLEVWRSRGTTSGPYEELTSNCWRPAKLPKGASETPSLAPSTQTVNIVGETLEFLLKEKDSVLIVFAGVDPLTTTQVASQITAQSAGRLSSFVNVDAQLVVSTMEPGTGATLRVLPSNAASFLALPLEEPDSLAFGQDARIQLIQGQDVYRFSDIAGNTRFFYKIRFRNSSTGAVSEYSLPFGTGQAIGLSTDRLICGYLDLVTADGKPLIGRRASLSVHFNGSVVDGMLVAGTALSSLTDNAGHVEFQLVRGVKYDLAIAGLNLVKTITAPDNPLLSSFPLLDPDFSEFQDYFRVRIPQIPTLLGST